MFEAIRGWWRDFKINADFPRYEAIKRREHEALARNRYDVDTLKRELEGLMRPHREEVERIFGEPIEVVTRTIARLDQNIQEMRRQLAVLEADFSTPLNELHARVNEVRERQKELHIEKKEAFDQLNEAKSDIDRWHRKSKGTFFGNGGKPLPKHSLFGQSFGDLDGYKSDRENAGIKIGRIKDELDDLTSEQNDLWAKINKLKASRDEQNNLRRQGLSPRRLQNDLSRATERRQEQNEVLTRLQERSREMLKQAWYRVNAQPIQDEIDRRNAAHKQFLASFDEPSAKADRVSEHRRQFR